jgi:hypothetical protein
MANLFDASNYPSQEPETLVVGDRWVWQRPDLVTDYPTDQYALTYEFHIDSGGGGSHKFTMHLQLQMTTQPINTSGMRLSQGLLILKGLLLITA